MESRHTKSMASWVTRTLATMIAGGYMVDSKKGNPALDMAMKLTIDDLEAAQLEDGETNAKKAQLAEPAIGSYERFMGAFGGQLTYGEEVSEHGG